MNDEVKLYSSGTFVCAATVMTEANLVSGGNDSMVVSSGGTANSTVLLGGRLDVADEGIVNNTTNSKGGMYVFGTANGTILTGKELGDAYMDVSSGGIASNTTITSGGKAFIRGGTADSTIMSGGGMVVSSGGIAKDTIVSGGFFDIYRGTAKDTILLSHGSMTISGEGTHSGTLQITSGAIVSAYAGAKIDFTVAEQLDSGSVLINDWSLISGGADASYTITVNADQGTGKYFLAKGAENFNNTITVKTTAGTEIGTLNVSSFFTYNSRTYSLVRGDGNLGLQIASAGPVISGFSRVNDGETLNNATIVNGGLSVASGGTANCTTISGGALYVSSGGTANNTITNGSSWDGGILYVSEGGIANNTIMSGGFLYVSSGGTATGITIQSDVECTLRTGGKITDVQILSGAFVNFTGGYEDSVSATGEMESAVIEGVLSANHSKYGVAIVRSGTVLSGGSVIIDEKCSAAQNILSAGGAMTIRDKAQAEDTQVTGGTLYVLQGGIATGSEISDKGKLMLSGKALDTTVSTDGTLFVLGGSVAEDISVDGGSVFVATGGEVKGDISISQSGGLYLYGGSIVEGDIHVKGTLYVDETMVNNGKITIELNENPLLCSMVENLDYMNGTDNFSVETNGLDSGCYRIASGAGDYNGTITVENDGIELGTLAVGETKDFDGVNYSLVKDEDELSIRLEAVVRIAAKSDVDGNGVSDVMFQYTGGDYQIGFWMNGTSTWQGQGISQPSNWELLGAYDMDQNGKADIVMRGNIQIGTEKGAYIGYYKDGDVTNWQNISFLNNPDDIDWRLAIGNVTGNDGCNSIVWHAPELGALGVWTDGTSNWVSLAGGFDSNWNMLGCGDFDGNGKDEVLFSNSGNLYTTDIEQKFVSLGGWGSDWEVKTIGDFSGDGKDDLILQNGNMVVKFENGLAENWSSIGAMDAQDWFIVGAGDYNGDQQDDLLVRQYSTGMLGYYVSGDMSKWVEMGRGVDMNWTVIA